MKLANHPHFVELRMVKHLVIFQLIRYNLALHTKQHAPYLYGCVHLKSRLSMTCSLVILSYVRWLLFPQFVHRKISVCLSKVDVKVYCCFVICSYSVQYCVVVVDFSDFLIAHLQLVHQLLSMYLIFIE